MKQKISVLVKKILSNLHRFCCWYFLLGKWVCSRCSSKGKSVATVSNQQVFVIDDDEEDGEAKVNMEVDKSKTPPPPTTTTHPVKTSKFPPTYSCTLSA